MTDALSPNACKVFVQALADAALVVDAQMSVIAANSLASEILEVRLEGQPISPFLRSPDFLGALGDVLQDSVPRKVNLSNHAKIQRRLDAYISPIGRNDRGPLALITLRDRTREEQVERMRTDFVANASHELRTPLTILSGFIETMQGAASKDEKARSTFLDLMKAQASRMSSLIDDLLSLSRIELDAHIIPDKRINLVDVVSQTANLLTSLVHEMESKVEIDLSSHLMVRGDESQLAQVVQNLLENAIKYSGRGKTISVQGKVDGLNAVLAIRDNGPGIAAHHLPRLTERFYRVSTQDSRTRGGTGLGLAICKHIVIRHRGRLLIKSVVGEGSEFSIEIPHSEST